MNLDDFKNLVRTSKGGYFQHDMRDPQNYEDLEPAVEVIREIDRAFIDAANELDFDLEKASNFGNSQDALDTTDRIVSEIMTISEESKFTPVKSDPYVFAKPEFVASMKVFGDE